MFMRMAKLSSCVRRPDCAGPAANSEAVKVKYLQRCLTTLSFFYKRQLIRGAS